MDFKDIQNFKKDLLTLAKLDKTGEIKKIYTDFLKNEANGVFLKMNPEQMRNMAPDALRRATDAVSKLAGEIAESIEERLAPEEIMLVSGVMRTYSNRMRDMEAGYGRSKREAVSPISGDVEAMLTNFKPVYQAENSEKAASMITDTMGDSFNPYRMLVSADKIERNMLKYSNDDGFENIMGEIDDLNCKFNIYNGINELQQQLKALKKLENTEKNELMNADYKEVAGMANVARMEFRLESYKKALELGWPVNDLNTYARVDSYMRSHDDRELNQMKELLNAPVKNEADRQLLYQTFKNVFKDICEKYPDDRQAANVSMIIDKHINDVISAGEIENMSVESKTRIFDIEYDENGMPVHDEDDPELDEELEALQNEGANREINDLEAEQLLKETENEVNEEQLGQGGAVEVFFANAGEELQNNEELGAELNNLEIQAANEEAVNNDAANNNVDNNNAENNNVADENAENNNIENENNVNENVEQIDGQGQNEVQENEEIAAENNEEVVNDAEEGQKEEKEEEQKEEQKEEEKEKEEEKKEEERKREEEQKEEEQAAEEKEAEEKEAEEKEPEIEKLSLEEYQGILDKLGDVFSSVEDLIDMNKEMRELGSLLRKQNPQRDQSTFELLGTLAACERLGENCTVSEMKAAYGKLLVETNAYLKNMDDGTYNNARNTELREFFEGIRDKAKEIYEGIDEKVLAGDEYAMEYDKPLSGLKEELQEKMDTLTSEYEKYGGRIKKEEPKEEQAEEEKEEQKEEQKKEDEDEFDPNDLVPEEHEEIKKEEEIAAEPEKQEEEKKEEEPEKKEEKKEEEPAKKEEEPEKKEEQKKEEPEKKEENKKEENKKEENRKEENKKEEEPVRVAVNVEGWGKEHFVYESKYTKKTNLETLKKEENKEKKREPKPDYGKLRMSRGTQIEIKAEKEGVMENNKPLLPKKSNV